jgi:hypothetical protein
MDVVTNVLLIYIYVRETLCMDRLLVNYQLRVCCGILWWYECTKTSYVLCCAPLLTTY